MAKVIIIAPSDAEDIDDAVKILKSAGHDVDVEEPTAKTLLHITLGLFGASAYGFGPQYAVGMGGPSPKPGKDDDKPEKDDDAPPEDAEDAEDVGADDTGGGDFSFESLGTVNVDGELMEAVRVKGKSTLAIPGLVVGSRISYTVNESTVSFWPEDLNQPVARSLVESNGTRVIIDLKLHDSDKVTKPTLFVGDDLAGLLSAK